MYKGLYLVFQPLGLGLDKFLFDWNSVIHNGNNKWKEAIDLEIEQIKEYQVFKDFGKAVYEKNKITNAPEGHQKIRVHFVFDVKHFGKFKARLVADGHLTKEPM